MSRNIVPRTNKGSDLGTTLKRWGTVYSDAINTNTIILSDSNLQAVLDGKVDLSTLMAKGDLYVATGSGAVTRLPAGTDGYVLKANSGVSEGLMWGPAGARQELTSNMTVTVGSTGDFNTINEALENIVALYYPKYISHGNCPRVTIRLLQGFVMAEQVLVRSLDLSWITITGDDEETIIDRSALYTYFAAGYPAFAAETGGFLPVIEQLFSMNAEGNSTNRHGISIYNNSQAYIAQGCGVKNAGGNGLYVINNSTVEAAGANFSNAGLSGIYASDESSVNAPNIDVSNATEHGITAWRSSIINASEANASNAGQNGIYAYAGSIINAGSANASGAGSYGIYANRGSIINASSVDASEADNYGFMVYMGSIINATDNAVGTLNQAPNEATSQGIIFSSLSYPG